MNKVLRELICRNIGSNVETPICCPRCSGGRYVKFGHTPSGGQRYLCHGCHRTFSEGSMRNLLSNSKLPAETWLEYCRCFANRYSLRKSAGICNVSLNTSFFMRRRILEILFKHLPPFRVSEGTDVQLDEIFIRESFKGSNRHGRIPRRSRKRGGLHKSGLNREPVCVMTGCNDIGDMFFDIAGKGKLSCMRGRAVAERWLRSGVIVTTDNEPSYRSVLRGLKVAEHSAYDDREHGHLAMVDSYHSRIRLFLHPFRGVSTRWLEQYLGWQKYAESFGSETAEGILGRIFHGRYSTTRSKMYPAKNDSEMSNSVCRTDQDCKRSSDKPSVLPAEPV